MAREPIRLSFKIDAYERETIPMARLAEYMANLAALAGERDNVHFVQVEDGCINLVHDVRFEAFPKVEARLLAVAAGVGAPAEAMEAERALNRKLAEDNTHARYTRIDLTDKASEFIFFPGALAPKPIEIIPIEQSGEMDGVIVGIGGRHTNENRVPVLVDTGEAIIACVTRRGVAKELGHYLLDTQRRFRGVGEWTREESGAWTLKRFVIQSHEDLDTAPLSDVVSRLRRIPSELGTGALSEIIQDRTNENDLN